MNSALLEFIVNGLLIVSIICLTSWLLSFVTPKLVHLLNDVRETLMNGGVKQGLNWIGEQKVRLYELWDMYRKEPIQPYRLELQHLQSVLSNLGKTQMEDLVAAEAKLTIGIRTLVQELGDIDKPQGFDPEIIKNGLENKHEARGLLTVFLLLIVVIGILNSWFLSIFFSEILGGHLIIFKPIQIQTSQALAIMFAVMEVAAGVALHHFESETKETPATKFFKLAPWIMLLSLTFVEFVAYAKLSQTANIAGSFGLDPQHGLYPMIQFFLAFLGAAISLALGALGYMLWSEWQKLSSGKRSLKVLKLMKQFAKANEKAGASAIKTQGLIMDVRRSVTGFVPNLVTSFRETLGQKEIELTVLEHLAKVVEGIEKRLKEDPPHLISRTNTEFMVWVTARLFLLIVWGGVIYAAFLLFSGSFSRHLVKMEGLPNYLGDLLGIVLALGLALTGYQFTRAWSHRKNDQVNIDDRQEDRHSNTALILPGFLILLGIVISAYAMNDAMVLGDSMIGNIALGAFIPLIVTIASQDIYYSFALLVGLLQGLLWLVAVSAGYGFAIVIFLVCLILSLSVQILQIVAMPGDVVRSLFGGRPSV